jgi:tripartite-type tricarboxylate transporter receptor subunit TctC
LPERHHPQKAQPGADMKVPRRHFLHLTGSAATLLAISQIATAQTYPTRPITLVVPVAAGGGVDTAARILSEKLQETLKQPVTVENRPGAGSMIGASFVARSPPDGYILLLMEPAALLAKWMNKATYDATTDFGPIALVATQPLVLFAQPSLPVNDVKELIAYCKANPGKLSVGTAGVGSPHHLAAAWLNTAAKIEITHVPYRGAAPALNDLLGGQIPLIWALSVAVMPFVEQGKVKALGVSTQRRFPLLPQVPTVAESGVPGFDIDFFYGIAAPAKVPPEVVARVGAALREITNQPDVRERMSALGMSVDYRDSDQFRKLITIENEKYGAIVHEAGIHPD